MCINADEYKLETHQTQSRRAFLPGTSHAAQLHSTPASTETDLAKLSFLLQRIPFRDDAFNNEMIPVGSRSRGVCNMFPLIILCVLLRAER